jgi:hypothetical protein
VLGGSIRFSEIAARRFNRFSQKAAMLAVFP